MPEIAAGGAGFVASEKGCLGARVGADDPHALGGVLYEGEAADLGKWGRDCEHQNFSRRLSIDVTR